MVQGALVWASFPNNPKLPSYQECLPFAWNFGVGFLKQMEQSKYDAVPFVKNDPVELSRLGRLVPRFTKSSTVGERMARVRFLQMVQFRLKRKKRNTFEGIPSIPEIFTGCPTLTVTKLFLISVPK